jgi:hypothetical protein
MSPVKEKFAHSESEGKDRAYEKVLTMTELAFYVGTSPQTIREMMEVELISPCMLEPEPCFHTDILPTVRRMLRIHQAIGVGMSSLPLVLDLLNRAEQLEDELNHLTSQMQ